MLQAGDASQALGTALRGLETLPCCNPLDCTEPLCIGVGSLTPIREPEACANITALKSETSGERRIACTALQQPAWVLGGRGPRAAGGEERLSALHVDVCCGHGRAGTGFCRTFFQPLALSPAPPLHIFIKFYLPHLSLFDKPSSVNSSALPACPEISSELPSRQGLQTPLRLCLELYLQHRARLLSFGALAP